MKKILCWVLSVGLLFPPGLVPSAWAEQRKTCAVGKMLTSCHEDWHRPECVNALFKNRSNFTEKQVENIAECSEKLDPKKENDKKV